MLKTTLASTLYCIDHRTESLTFCNRNNHKPKAAAALSTSDTSTTGYNITFDLNCSGNSTECAGVKATFQKATEIISSAFQLKSPLVINATYGPFCSSTKNCGDDGSMESIGQAYPSISYIMVDQTDNITRMYPQALLKQYTDLSVQPSWTYYDIDAQFNSQVDWYFFDNPKAINSNQIDFLKNVLHELIHGLGFLTSWSDGFYKSISPLIDNLDHFATPRLLAEVSDGSAISNYNISLPFWGFVEFPFDKFISANASSGDFSPFSAVTKQLNQFYNANALFHTAIDFANAWYVSDAYKQASNMYQKSITVRDTTIMINNQPILLLETGISPFSDGSTLCHVDLDTNVNSSEYLMVYVANRGVTLGDLRKKYSLGPLGPKLLTIMANLGYQINSSYNIASIQPSLSYWSPSSDLVGTSSNPTPAQVTMTNGPAHMPTSTSSTLSESNVSSTTKSTPWLPFIIINILLISLI